MSKPKKTNKVLVRNPVVSFRPAVKTKKSHKLKTVRFVEEGKVKEEPKDLTSPEFCSILQLANEVRKIKSAPDQTYRMPDVPRHRNLNFPPRERIYQDLIDLDVPVGDVVSELKSQPCFRISSRKDPEPDCSKYLKYSLQPEYSFPSCVVPNIRKQTTVFDGWSVYNKINSLKVQS